jgi:hypothetical protein
VADPAVCHGKPAYKGTRVISAIWVSSLQINILFRATTKNTTPDNVCQPTMRQRKELTPF